MRKNIRILYSDHSGFTLVELLVALFILLIISVAFLTLFVNSYGDIMRSGVKNKGLYEAQQSIEQAISAGYSGEEKELEISFPGIDDPLTIGGVIVTEDVDVKGKKSSVSIFIPK